MAKKLPLQQELHDRQELHVAYSQGDQSKCFV